MSSRSTMLILAAVLLSYSNAWASGRTPAAAAGRSSDMRQLDRGAHGNPQVVPPQALPGGASYADWCQRYEQWAVGIPTSLGLFDDGSNFALNQTGSVWFLQPGCGDRTCTMPAGRYLLVPLFFAWNEYPCPDPNFHPAPEQSMEDFLAAGLASYFPGPPDPGSLVVDGVAINSLPGYYAQTHLFTLTFDPSWGAIDGCVTGGPQPNVGGGYFYMLKPLSPGTHTLEFPFCGTTTVLNVAGGAVAVQASVQSKASPTSAPANRAGTPHTWGWVKSIYR